MKLGIITFHNTHNFGAELQAYALQYYLISKNHDVEFINYRLKQLDEQYALLYKPTLYLSGFKKSLLHLFVRMGRAILRVPYGFKRKIKYDAFKTQYLNISELDNDNKHSTYDVVICGSDQIWNPRITNGFNDKYFGNIAKSSKKISYAASMGEYDLTNDDKKIFSKLINQLDLISVRENKTKEICEKYTTKCVNVVLDPVFLLNKEEWDKLAIAHNVNKKYILIYNINNHEEIRQKAFELSNKYGYEIIELIVNRYFVKERHKLIYSAGPQDFLGWIKNAEIILTSSFHGVAFSIIYKKEFYAFNTTRIESLLKQVGLEDRLLHEDMDHAIQTDKKINYNNVYIKLEKLINYSKHFLNNALQNMV